MTSLSITQTALVRQRKENPLGLYIAVIKEIPDAGEAKHKREFKRLVLSEGYEDFVEAIVEEWQSIKYSTALRAAQPPTVKEIRAAAAKRKVERQREDKLVETAKQAIGRRLMSLVMPNGKTLADCTGAECAKFGGLYTAISQKVGSRQLVGQALSSDDLAQMAAKFRAT